MDEDLREELDRLTQPFDPDHFVPIVVRGRKLEVRLEYIGEGYDGDYNPEYDLDAPLLRFYVRPAKAIEEDFEESRCTALDVRAKRSELERIASEMLREFEHELRRGGRLSKLADKNARRQLGPLLRTH